MKKDEPTRAKLHRLSKDGAPKVRIGWDPSNYAIESLSGNKEDNDDDTYAPGPITTGDLD